MEAEVGGAEVDVSGGVGNFGDAGVDGVSLGSPSPAPGGDGGLGSHRGVVFVNPGVSAGEIGEPGGYERRGVKSRGGEEEEQKKSHGVRGGVV